MQRKKTEYYYYKWRDLNTPSVSIKPLYEIIRVQCFDGRTQIHPAQTHPFPNYTENTQTVIHFPTLFVREQHSFHIWRLKIRHIPVDPILRFTHGRQLSRLYLRMTWSIMMKFKIILVEYKLSTMLSVKLYINFVINNYVQYCWSVFVSCIWLTMDIIIVHSV